MSDETVGCGFTTLKIIFWICVMLYAVNAMKKDRELQLRQVHAVERVVIALENEIYESAATRETVSKEANDARDRLKVLESRVTTLEDVKFMKGE